MLSLREPWPPCSETYVSICIEDCSYSIASQVGTIGSAFHILNNVHVSRHFSGTLPCYLHPIVSPHSSAATTSTSAQMAAEET